MSTEPVYTKMKGGGRDLAALLPSNLYLCLLQEKYWDKPNSLMPLSIGRFIKQGRFSVKISQGFTLLNSDKGRLDVSYSAFPYSKGEELSIPIEQLPHGIVDQETGSISPRGGDKILAGLDKILAVPRQVVEIKVDLFDQRKPLAMHYLLTYATTENRLTYIKGKQEDDEKTSGSTVQICYIGILETLAHDYSGPLDGNQKKLTAQEVFEEIVNNILPEIEKGFG